MSNCINITLKKNEILIKIAEDAEQKEIIVCLKKKIEELKKLYKEEKTPIFITGKVLKNKEIEEIQKVIKSAIDVKIEFDSPKVLGLHGIKKTFNKYIETSETMFHKGSLRSGQRIEFEGSIVVIGDVNGGSEVVAGENIIVLGNLRGLAHAGAKGNKQAIIAAEGIDVPQIRISKIVKEIEKVENDEIKIIPTYAYLNEQDEMIFE